ncbi:MAG: molybdopterin-dependent oxidoreductase [Acidobacteriota bacterium]
MSDILTRRDFLFIGGATVAGVTLGETGRRLLARADARQATTRVSGLQRWATTVCRECPAACGVRVRLIDDVPVKLEGNPLCPLGRGRLCAMGQAAIEGYFDPDRLTGPARRVGKRGEHKWEPITWDAAIADLASHLSGVPSDPAAQGLAFAVEEHGPLAQVWGQFWDAGGAKPVWMQTATSARLRRPFAALTGVDAEPLFDLEHATHVLSFGAPLAETWLSPVWAQRAFGRFRRSPSRSRGRLVQVDAHRSMTARKADEWVAVAGEQQAVLAYGLASVILRESRADRLFLDAFGGNQAAFEREIVDTYPPDEVATATGVPVVTVLRLARDLAASPRPLVICPADAPTGLINAVFALNALLGALDREGGIVASPAPPVDAPNDGSAVLREMVAGTRRPYLIALRDASALRSLAAPAGSRAAIEAAPFIVGFSPYLDETADLADLLLPRPTPLEDWHAVTPPSVVRAECQALARPAVAARLDTRDSVAVLGSVAAKVGGALARAFAWTSSAGVVDADLERLYAARRGEPYSDAHETTWLGELERGGWWVSSAPTKETFAQAALDAGGWDDPFFAPGGTRESLKARGGVSWPDARLTLTTGPAPGRPAVETPTHVATNADEPFPLRLVAFTPATVAAHGGANNPSLFELLGQPEGQPWRVWAELSPDTAKAFGIVSGSEVRLTSASGGALNATALVVDGMMPATVAVAFVPTLPSGGRWARLVHADVRTLIGAEGRRDRFAVRISAA